MEQSSAQRTAMIAAMTTMSPDLPRLDFDGTSHTANGGKAANSPWSAASEERLSTPLGANYSFDSPLDSPRDGSRPTSDSPGPTSPARFERSKRESIRLAAQSSHKKGVHHHQLSPREEEIMNNFEALDYDVIENKLFEREQLLSDARDTKNFGLMTWLVFFLIGIGTGTTAFLIDKGVETLLEIRWDATYDTLRGEDLTTTEDDNVVGSFVVDVILCGLYVAVASGLVVWVEPAAAGSGIPDMKGYLNGTNLRGALTYKALVAKAVGVVFSVGGGLCVGKEGPLVHTGSVLGANISHGFNACTLRFQKWNRFRNDAYKRDFVSAGCAAGVAAAFGAPMGGVLFAFEEASSFWSLPLTWKCFFCAATATFTLNFWLSMFNGEGVMNGINSPRLITFGTFKDSPYALWELPVFGFLAVVGGLLGAIFNEINQKLSVWRRDRGWSKPAKQIECVLTAMLTGAVFFMLPRFYLDDCRPLPDGLDNVHNTEKFYNRYECTEDKTYNAMASMSFAGQEKTIHGFFHSFTAEIDDDGYPAFVYGSSQLVVYLLTYFTLAVWTYGIQVPSGLFVPGIISGCAFGRLTGEWVRYYQYDPNCFDSFTDCVTRVPASCCPAGGCLEQYEVKDPLFCERSFANAARNGPMECPDGCWFTPSIQTDCVKMGTAEMECHVVRPGLYAFMGACCMLGGMTRMTVSLCVILMETTDNIQYLLPIMLTLTLSKVVGDQFNISLYDMHVEIKCIPFLEFKPPAGMEQLHAEDLMSTPVVTFDDVESAETIYRRLQRTKHNGFPVLLRGTNKFVGVVLRSQLIVLLKLRAFCGENGLNDPSRMTQVEREGSTESAVGGGLSGLQVGGMQITSQHFATALQSEVPSIDKCGVEPHELTGKYLDLRPVMNPRPFSVGEDTSLVRVFRLCRAMGIRHLPVVNIDNEVVGMITRKELRADFTQDLY